MQTSRNKQATRLHICILRNCLFHYEDNLNCSPVDKFLGKIHNLRSQILAAILSKSVISAASIIASVKVIVQQEMNGSDVGHFEPINGFAFVFFRTEQLSDSVDRQKAPQPVPFIVVSHEEADVAVTALVTRPSEDDSSQRETYGWAERVKRHGRLGLIRGLLSVIRAKLGGQWYVNDALGSIPE